MYGVVLLFCGLLLIGHVSIKNDPEYYVRQEQQKQEKEQKRNLNIQEYRAVNKAKDQVTSNLLSPSSARFGDIKAEHSRSTGAWRISGYVDSKNGFGVTVRNRFSIIVHADEIR